MPKFQFLLRPAAGQSAADFSSWVRDDLSPDLLRAKPRGLKVSLADSDPPRLAVIPFQRRALALISIWSRDPDDPGGEWTKRVDGGGCRLAAYRVAESIPVGYQPDWPLGAPTPGAGLLTLLRRKRGLSDQVFMERWHQGHSSISLDIHPLWNYVRNVVESTLTDGAEPLDGIVEEHFRTRAELLDPRVFFGGTLRMLPNMLRVAFDISRFLDLVSLQSYLVEEVILQGIR